MTAAETDLGPMVVSKSYNLVCKKLKQKTERKCMARDHRIGCGSSSEAFRAEGCKL